MGTLNPNDLCERLQHLLPNNHGSVALHEPCFADKEWLYVKDCLDTGWVSTAGQYVPRFEQAIAAFTGCKHAIAMVNGTSALHTCLLALGVGSGEEVLMPSLTFVATANAISYTGAIPHFIDICHETLTVDCQKLEVYLAENTFFEAGGSDQPVICVNRHSKRRIRVLVAVHTFGHPVDIAALEKVCSHYHIQLVEDAAESLGSYYYGSHTGSRALMATLSFNGNKIVTSGGGGAILTNDDGLAAFVRHISTTARRESSWRFEHDAVAYNYRMPNLNAALGLAQLEQISGFLSKKRHLAQRYQAVFADCEGVSIFQEAAYATSNYWLNVMLLNEDVSPLLKNTVEFLQSKGYQVRPAWRLMHELPMYGTNPRMNLDQAEDLAARIICLPSSAALLG